MVCDHEFMRRIHYQRRTDCTESAYKEWLLAKHYSEDTTAAIGMKINCRQETESSTAVIAYDKMHVLANSATTLIVYSRMRVVFVLGHCWDVADVCCMWNICWVEIFVANVLAPVGPIDRNAIAVGLIYRRQPCLN